LQAGVVFLKREAPLLDLRLLRFLLRLPTRCLGWREQRICSAGALKGECLPSAGTTGSRRFAGRTRWKLPAEKGGDGRAERSKKNPHRKIIHEFIQMQKAGLQLWIMHRVYFQMVSLSAFLSTVAERTIVKRQGGGISKVLRKGHE